MSEMGLETNGIESKNKVSNTFRLVLFDQENIHSHPNSTNTSISVTRRNMLPEQELIRLKRELKSSSNSEYDKVMGYNFYFNKSEDAVI
jgi:hypothetical protein